MPYQRSVVGMENVSYEELDKIVLGFQTGCPGYAEMLLKAYDGFIAKYVNLLHDGTIYPDNDRMRQFIGLYVSRHNIRRYLDSYVYMPNVKAAIYSTANMLAKIFASYKKAEIYNEIVSVLLELAMRYSRGRNPTFHLYADKVFNYYLKKHLKSIVSDPLIRAEWIEFDDTQYETEGENLVETDQVYERIHEAIEIKRADTPVVNGGGLNLNWINGVTATNVFRMLDAIDRQILVMHYIDKMKDAEIAEALGYGSRETICRRRNKAKAVIEQYAQNNNMYGLREGSDILNQSTKKVSSVRRKTSVQHQQDTKQSVKTRIYCAGVVR